MTTLGQKFELHQSRYKGWWKGLAKPITARCPMCEQGHTVNMVGGKWPAPDVLPHLCIVYNEKRCGWWGGDVSGLL